MKFNKTKKFLVGILSLAMVLSSVPAVGGTTAKAAEETGTLTSVKSAEANGNIVTVTFNDDITGKITFLEDGIFRYNVDPKKEFGEYAPVPAKNYPDTAKIQQYPDSSDNYAKPTAKVVQEGENWVISGGTTKIIFDADAKMMIKSGDKVVMEEKTSLKLGNATVQTLKENGGDQFFGGGTQNGRFVHTGKEINIANESKWADGNVSSPNPFYYSTAGYGVLRNTYANGKYNFGAAADGIVTATHNENEFDAYYFVSDADNNTAIVQDLLQGYFHVTGNPALLPAYGFYLGHLNAYNRDAWSKENIGKQWTIKGNAPYNSEGTSTYESGDTGFEIKAGQNAETLNGYGPQIFTEHVPDGVTYLPEFSARAVLDEYLDFDMPFGFFLPNDGYGAGYGQNGYKMTGGVQADGTSSADRLAAVAANVENLKEFADYAAAKGIATGLWTQSNLTPDSNNNTLWHLLRDFYAEVKAGVTTLKTDVAWVGPGYSFQLSGVKQAYDIVTTTEYEDGRANTRPNIISLDGWAGSQRYNSVWTGDQTGGNWEYIRFHIPTFIGQSLSGNPNIGCDMDGIWGGSPVIATRDYQWKSFAPQMLDMDGWGTFAKGPYVHGDPYTGVSRMYLKMKAMMMPYIYTNAYAAANIDTKNDDQGLPMIRAMFLEFPDDANCYGNLVQYQYMWGKNLLVAPVYEDNGAGDFGNDVRHGIYLPGGENQIWIDYFTGEQYRGGQVLNSFDAPLWKIPLFVKNGAIIPMYEEHNVASMNAEGGVDKSKRIVEFWPDGNSEFNTIEDDGTFIQNNLQEAGTYGTIDNISYGDHIETLYTSKVDGTTATLTANESEGKAYAGYEPNKDTTFIVHASKKPTELTAKNGNTALTGVEAADKAAFDSREAGAGEFVYFYDNAPEIETFASSEERILASMVANAKVSGKLYVKFAKTNADSNAQTLVIKGFENAGELPATGLDPNLAVPELTWNEDATTPTSIALSWDAVPQAMGYELCIDGAELPYTITGGRTTFTHVGLAFKSTHTYKIRTKGANGYSDWSQILTAVSKDDPFLNTPKPVKVTWDGEIWSTHGPELAFDELFQSGDGGFHSDGPSPAKDYWLTADYGNAYLFDKIEYYPRTDAANGTATKLHIETSLDGVHWIAQPNDFDFVRDADTKEMNLVNPINNAQTIGARFVRIKALESVGNFFSASEIKTYTITEAGKIPAGNKQAPFKVGNQPEMGMTEATESTFVQMYKKESSSHGSDKNSTWVGEIQGQYLDINFNGISDIYDYAFTAFDADGGTQKKGTVSGKVKLVPGVTEIASGDTFTIDVTADNVKNMNAYGTIINYDPRKVEYVGVSYNEELVGTMYTSGMTGGEKYDDTAYVNHNAINMGDQPLVNAESGVLSTITMRAKTDIVLNNVTDITAEDFIIDLSTVAIMGPDFSYKECNVSDQEGPEDGNRVIEFKQSDFDITMTNDELPIDDGSNVGMLIQNAKDYSGAPYYYGYPQLFNGSYGREFEFLWKDTPNIDEEGNLPSYIKFPTTMHFALKTPALVDNVKVYNAEGATAEVSNGYLTKASAQLVYVDGTKSDEIVISSKDVYEFNFVPENAVAGIDVTFLEATQPDMLTLGEIEITGREIKMEEVFYGQDDFNITMTNEVLPEDDGTNVSTMIQQNDYKGLFNGSYGREWEFKWNATEDTHPFLVFPTTLHLDLKNPSMVEHVAVYNAPARGNGYLTKAGVQFVYEDDSRSEELEIALEDKEVREILDFNLTPEKNVKRIDIIFKETTNPLMLTLSEIKVSRQEYVMPEPEAIEFGQSDFDLTLTNRYFKTDDGSNVTKLIEQNKYDALFNGSNDREFEFKWDYNNGTLPTYVKLPATLHMKLKTPALVNYVAVYNADNAGNGYLAKAKAQLVYTDGTMSEAQQIDTKAAEYEFSFEPEKNVERVDITFLEETGNGAHLTVGEVKVSGLPGASEDVPAVDKAALNEAIAAAKDLNPDDYVRDEIYDWVAAMQAVLANAESAAANEKATQADVNFAKAALNEAVRELTPKADKTALNEAIAAAEALNAEDYTAASWTDVVTALAAANLVAANESATKPEIDAAAEALNDALSKLVEVQKYHVTVTGGKMEDESAEGYFVYNKKLTVTADAETEDGKFAGWEVNGKLVSANNPYTFYVGTDLDIVAVYKSETAAVEAQAILQSVSVTKNAADPTKSDIRYLAQLVLPEGAKLNDAGLVWRTTNDQEDLVIGGSGVKITRISKISNTYQFSVTIKGVPAGRIVPGKVFATIDGKTIYSECRTNETNYER